MSSILIKNGMAVNYNGSLLTDIYIVGEKIKEIAPNLNYKADQMIDATNMCVFPGGIDVHTHMELPVMGTFSSDSFATGSLAALFGGTTTIIDFANQTKGDSLDNALGRWHQKAYQNCYCDYSFHISITDPTPSVLTELDKIVREEGITSFKTFMAYDHMKLNENEYKIIMDKTKELNCLLTAHAENGDEIAELINESVKNNNLTPEFHHLSRPDYTEEDATTKLLAMSKKEKCPIYIVHMSTKKALDATKESQKENNLVFAETCIQYLILNNSVYQTDDKLEAAKFILSPPLRNQNDSDALWKGLSDGSIQVVATDHCPFMISQKSKNLDDFRQIPNGVPGVENRIELLYSEGVANNKITLEQFVAVSSTNPAKLFGLYPQKGTIENGADADLIIFDPEKEHVISKENQHMNCDYSIYQDMSVKGKCSKVLLRGNIVIDDDRKNVRKDYGRFLKRTTPTFDL